MHIIQNGAYAEKFVVLVQERYVLYNLTSKKYHDSNVVSKVWEEISNEMKAPGE